MLLACLHLRLFHGGVRPSSLVMVTTQSLRAVAAAQDCVGFQDAQVLHTLRADHFAELHGHRESSAPRAR